MHTLVESTLYELEKGTMTRRQAAKRLGTLIAMATGAGALHGEQVRVTDGTTFQATGLDHIALRVTDIGRSKEFYMKHLGLTLSSEGRSSAFLNCGNNFVALFRGDVPKMDHYCYSVKDYDAGDAVDRLKAAGLPDIRRTGNRVYFSDPDNLTVQVAAGSHHP